MNTNYIRTSGIQFIYFKTVCPMATPIRRRPYQFTKMYSIPNYLPSRFVVCMWKSICIKLIRQNCIINVLENINYMFSKYYTLLHYIDICQ